MANEQTKEETYAYYYHTNYIRNARAIAIAWAIFTLCFFIIMLVVFLQPYWLGDGPNSRGVGYFGLYRHCVTYSTVGELSCSSDSVFSFEGLKDPDGNTYGYMAAATFFVGVSALFVALSILGMLLFLCKSCKTGTVFFTCGVMQFSSAICLVIGILIYPGGWAKHDAYRNLCGDGISYTNTAGCELRWVFYLAIIAVFDAFILAILAFILANKQDKLHMDMHFSDYYKNNNGNSVHAKPKKHGTVNSTIFNTYPHRGHDSERPALNGSTTRDEPDSLPIPPVEDAPPYAKVTNRSRSSGTADDEMSSTSRSSKSIGKSSGKSSQKSSLRSDRDETL